MSMGPHDPNAGTGVQGVLAGKGVALSATPSEPQKFIMSELYCLEIEGHIKNDLVTIDSSGMPGSQTGMPCKGFAVRKTPPVRSALLRSQKPRETCGHHPPGRFGAVCFWSRCLRRADKQA